MKKDDHITKDVVNCANMMPVCISTVFILVLLSSHNIYAYL